AFLLGCAAAFDAPARQTFVAELVSEAHLSNAVALNSTSFNAARMIGRAIAGLLIAAVGTAWGFLSHAAPYGARLLAISMLRIDELNLRERLGRSSGGFLGGLRYTLGRPDLILILFMLLLVGTFAINFPIFISTMAVSVFHAGASQFGLLTSMMAVGSVSGALLAARREQPRIQFLLLGSVLFGVGLGLAAVIPDYLFFGITLVFVGLSVQTFTTTANSSVQLWTDSEMRGRVMAIVLAIALGGTPIGAPIVGWVADRFGPRWGLALGASSGLVAA